MSPVPTTSRALTLTATLPLVLALALTAWTHRRSVFAFFSSPDDLRHLEQAVGLLPTEPSPFRVLSQVLYFRAMVRVVGLDPLPYHLVTYGCHLLNVALVFLLFRRWRTPAHVAAVAATLFGAMPLSHTMLSSAVGTNDGLSLCLALAALLAFDHRSRIVRLLSPLLFALSLLCKELVLFLPAVLLIARPDGIPVRARAARLAPHAGIAILAATGFFILRSHGLATDRVHYATAFGVNLFHNLMTLTAWATDLAHVMPDLISTTDVNAWKWSVLVLGFAGTGWLLLPAHRRWIAIGLAWWVLGLLPVLPLRFQTYRHYVYAALPGLALAVAAAAGGLTARFLTERGPRSGHDAAKPAAATTAVLVILAGLYAVRANHQIGRRMEARITGVDLARDPVLRRQQVAGRALASIAEGIDADTRRIVVLSPVGGGRVFGVRSGEEVRGGTGGREPYDLLRESIDHGRAVRLFHPRIDSVAFIAEWAHVYRDFDVFMPYQDGHLLGVGRGPRGLERAASWMMEQGWPGQARDHLGRAVAAYPDDRELRFSFARSLAASGDQAGAVGELTRLIEESPRDSLSTVAREVLRARPARAPDAGRPAMGKRTRSADTAR